MVIKNGYEARLAKMAGDENVTIPKPTNAYMKYMDDIETGGGGGSGTGWLKVTMTGDSESGVTTLDKTAGEIYASCPFVVAVEDDGGFFVYQLREYFFSNDEGYRFEFVGTDRLKFYAPAADDIPTEQEPPAPGPSPT